MQGQGQDRHVLSAPIPTGPNGPATGTLNPIPIVSLLQHSQKVQPPLVGSFFETPPLPFHSFAPLSASVVGTFLNTDYTRRFKKDFDRLDVTRMSLYEERAIPYIMYDCILFPEARRSVTRQGQPPSQYPPRPFRYSQPRQVPAPISRVGP